MRLELRFIFQIAHPVVLETSAGKTFFFLACYYGSLLKNQLIHMRESSHLCFMPRVSVSLGSLCPLHGSHTGLHAVLKSVAF